MKAQIIEQHGKKEYAVIPYKDFLRLQEEAEDYCDLQDLRRAKVDPRNRQGRPLDRVAAALGLKKGSLTTYSGGRPREANGPESDETWRSGERMRVSAGNEVRQRDARSSFLRVERCVVRLFQRDEQGVATSRIGTDVQRWARAGEWGIDTVCALDGMYGCKICSQSPRRAGGRGVSGF